MGILERCLGNMKLQNLPGTLPLYMILGCPQKLFRGDPGDLKTSSQNPQFTPKTITLEYPNCTWNTPITSRITLIPPELPQYQWNPFLLLKNPRQPKNFREILGATQGQILEINPSTVNITISLNIPSEPDDLKKFYDILLWQILNFYDILRHFSPPSEI